MLSNPSRSDQATPRIIVPGLIWTRLFLRIHLDCVYPHTPKRHDDRMSQQTEDIIVRTQLKGASPQVSDLRASYPDLRPP